jgi:hypothetical protein
LYPKHDLTYEQVITINIVSYFGNVKTFKTVNLLLPYDAKKEIETLY